MRNHRQPRYAVLLGALIFSALSLGLSLAWSVPTTLAAGPANAQATELVRLINGERAYLGKAALRTDTFLASKARDGAVACPNDASLVMAGRAKDFAVYGYPANSHLLRLCPTYTSMDAMKEWGYKGARGEITALNGGYGTAKVAYTYGCTPALRTCPGSTTSSYSTTAHAMGNWTSSSSHYAIIVGSYDRVGCGAWIGSNGAYYYDCMFSRGGRTVPKTTAPRSGGAAKPPAATQPAASPSPTDPLASATTGPTAGPTAVVAGVQATPSPDPDAARLAGAAQGGPQSDPPRGGAGVPATSRNLPVAAGAMTAVFSLFYGLLLTIKQRRPRDRATG
ncbi:MAG: CAP domain-containing protein [Candidatus Limnocylindrales bacterium]